MSYFHTVVVIRAIAIVSTDRSHKPDTENAIDLRDSRKARLFFPTKYLPDRK